MAIRTISNAGGSWTSVGTWVEGAVPTSADDVVCTGTSGNLTMPAGTLDCLSIDLTGYTGTWSGALGTVLRIRGNVTLGGTITTTTVLQQSLNSNTITSNGVVWSGSYQYTTSAINSTITGDFYITGFLNLGSNTLSGSNVYINNSLILTNSTGIGTSTFFLTGTGTWSGNFQLRHSLTIKSTASITLSGSIAYNRGSFIVEPGAIVNTGGSTLTTAATATTTFDISTIKLNNFILGGTSTVNTLVLSSPLYITGIASLGASSSSQTINGSPIYIESGTLTSGADNGGAILGSSSINLIGDNVSFLDSAVNLATGQPLYQLPIIIDIRGTCRMTGRMNLSTNSSFSIINGRIEHRDGLRNLTTLVVSNNTTLTNIDKCKFKNITINNGVTVTMNKFFTGSPEYKSRIRSNALSNFNIIFTDTIPKKAFFVNVQRCTVANRNQLNIIERDGNAGFNQGIIFGESGINGFPLNQFPTEPNYPFEAGFQTGGMNN